MDLPCPLCFKPIHPKTGVERQGHWAHLQCHARESKLQAMAQRDRTGQGIARSPRLIERTRAVIARANSRRSVCMVCGLSLKRVSGALFQGADLVHAACWRPPGPEAGAPQERRREDTRAKVKPARPFPFRILVVDDDPVLLEVFADVIRACGYQVEVAAEAGEALARLRTEAFDVLLTDIWLPGMDGWQLIASATHEQPMLRLLAMTGADGHQEGERAPALGVPLLRKPFGLLELRDALEAVTSP